MKKILVGLTTVTQGEWRNKVNEIDELGIKEIALFPTGLNTGERKELYKSLEKTGLKNIPHAHLRNDMEIDELDYLTERFKTRVFNIHAENAVFRFLNDYGSYDKKIYVENSPGSLPSETDLKKYAGLCLDLSHWESVKLDQGENSRENLALSRLAAKLKIGCNHISAVKPEKVTLDDRFTGEKYSCYCPHFLDDLSEVDYVKKYRNYLAEIISLELENSLKRQMEVKKYLETILAL